MKRRFVYNAETKEMEEVTHGSIQDLGPMVMGDIEPFISPVDGSVISSRSTLREHMRQHGLAHAADFDTPGGYWDKKRQARADYLAGKINPGTKKRKQQMSDAFEHLRNQSRYSRG